jgi:hypothetical protein
LNFGELILWFLIKRGNTSVDGGAHGNLSTRLERVTPGGEAPVEWRVARSTDSPRLTG